MKEILSIAAIVIGGMAVMTGCSKDSDDYEKKQHASDAERMSHAEKTLGVTIDKEQDWVLTNEYTVKITADADLENISEVAVLDGNPYVDEKARLARVSLTKNGSASLSFRVPKLADSVLYAACVTKDGQCLARPFIPGKDTEVSFNDISQTTSAARKTLRSAAATDLTPRYTNFYIKDFYAFRRAILKQLPKGQDNRYVNGGYNYTNTVEIRKNPYDKIYDLGLAYLGGNSDSDNNLYYNWYPGGVENDKKAFIVKDNYPAGWNVERYDPATREYSLRGHLLNTSDANGNLSWDFKPSDKLDFHVTKNGELLPDQSGERVKIFFLNGYVFIACEDSRDREYTDWDYNDRLFWIPYGADKLERGKAEPIIPEPTRPQVWTYAWEDRDFGDYDMNDCVIQVSEKEDDNTKLVIKLVALGATRDLWLGFDNPNATGPKGYQHVFDDELHNVFGVASGTMVNTGKSKASEISKIIDKPVNFDFQTCSFVLGAKTEGSEIGTYDSDFYYIKIATKGQDPHGIVIPGEWRWPTERTCIKQAYPEFVKWAADRTQAQDWYKYPVAKYIVNK